MYKRIKKEKKMRCIDCIALFSLINFFKVTTLWNTSNICFLSPQKKPILVMGCKRHNVRFFIGM